MGVSKLHEYLDAPVPFNLIGVGPPEALGSFENLDLKAFDM